MQSAPCHYTQLSPAVLQSLREKFLHYEGSPFSFVQTSHRSKLYEALNNATVDVIRHYFNVPDYEVLLMPSKSALASVYYNCVEEGTMVLFHGTGVMGEECYREMKGYWGAVERYQAWGDVLGRLQGLEQGRRRVLHYNGVEDGRLVSLPVIPETVRHDTIVIKNMNYCLDYSGKDHHSEDILYFETQTGFAVPGFTVVLLRKDFISRLSAKTNCPDMFDYLLMHKMKSVVNTPFTVCTLVLHDNLKYMTENRHALCQQILQCKQTYQKLLTELGYVCQSQPQNDERREEAINFVTVEVANGLERVTEVLGEMGWFNPRNNLLSLFVQSQNNAEAVLENIRQLREEAKE